MSYFKGEDRAKEIKNMLLPVITSTKTDDSGNQQSHVRITKFTSFIDMFNFFPITVNKIHRKNDSNELTYIMSSNTKGSEGVFKSLTSLENLEKKVSLKTEPRLMDLLRLTSEKI